MSQAKPPWPAAPTPRRPPGAAQVRAVRGEGGTGEGAAAGLSSGDQLPESLKASAPSHSEYAITPQMIDAIAALLLEKNGDDLSNWDSAEANFLAMPAASPAAPEG
jgi:hypothetical protein